MDLHGLVTQIQALALSLTEQVRNLSAEDQEAFSPTLQQLSTLLTSTQNLQPDNTFNEAGEYLKIIFENIKDYSIFTLDLNNRITYWNTGAERMFGFAEAEALGQSGEIIFTPEDRKKGEPEKEIRQTLETGRALDERWHLRKDGSRFFASGMMQIMTDEIGQRRGFVKIARDVTERRLAQISEREQRTLAEALREIAITLSSTLDLDNVLEHILITVEQVVPHDTANILLLEGNVIAHVRTRGYSQYALDALEKKLNQDRLLIDEIPLFDRIIESGVPFLIEDTRLVPEWRGVPLITATRSYIGAPIIAENRALGLLNLTSRRSHFFTTKHSNILQAFASQAAVAIRNAQLYLQTQELTALKERQQFARDLHDAVTQTLFTASMLSEALSQEHENQPDMLAENLALLHRLTRGALAEMRTLLFQLRPENLLNTPLKVLLRQLVDAVYSRKNIVFSVNVTGEPKLPPEVHIALYRIAQEAINNIVKHAQAESAWIELQSGESFIKLHIQDNGIGFIPPQSPSGMGLQMIQERAEAINAYLEIKNRPEGGTVLLLIWPAIAKDQTTLNS